MSSEALFPIRNGKYMMDAEPVVRIGVVLEEDRKAEIQFRVPGNGHSAVAGGRVLSLAPDVTYRVVAAGGDRLALRQAGTEADLVTGKLLRVYPPAGSRAEKAGDGIAVDRIVAGRGFHWLKEIDQTLSGILEFHPRGPVLLMVNELPVEEYLTGVITGEMSAECPPEYMKAQAVAARSWLLGQACSQHPGEPFFWCNDDHCQRYQGTGGWTPAAVQAMRDCRAEVLITPTNRYCDARYSKSTGGISEDAASVWGQEIEGLVAAVDAPARSHAHFFFPITEENLEEYLEGAWLRSTDCFASPIVVPEGSLKKYLGRVDEVGEYFRWHVRLTQTSLRESLTRRGGFTDLAEVLDLREGSRGRSGRLETLHVDYLTTTGERRTRTIVREYHIRAGLSMKFLYSSAFRIKVRQRSATGALEAVELVGAGWGHGAGLCQIGGLGRALKGQSHREILMHYYQGVRLEKIYP